MPGITGPIVKPNGVQLTLMSQYESDKKAIDKAVSNMDKPTPKKDQGKTVKRNTYNVDEESFADRDGAPMSQWKVSGLQSYDALYSLLGDDADPAAVAGNEGFVETIQNGVKELLRIIKSFFTWLWELVYNRVRSLTKRAKKLKKRLRENGIKLTDKVSYPGSIVRLMGTETIPNSPDFIVNKVKALSDFYHGLMSGEAMIKKSIVTLPDDLNHEQAMRLVHHTANAFATQAAGKALPASGMVSSDPLPGQRQLKVTMGDGDKYTGVNVSMGILPAPQRDFSKPLIPDASIAQRVLDSAARLVDDISTAHKSQSSMSRDFEKEINKLSRQLTIKDQAARKEAYRYYAWLVNFQHKSISSPMSYVFSGVNAALDYVDAMVK